MPGRSRNAKKLAQRIDLDYFKRLYPIPRWRRNLTFALLGVAALWLGWDALAGSHRIYTAGPLSRSHALLTSNCAACHATQAFFRRNVTDPACLACHDGPIHHADQLFTPPCAACHVEHQSQFGLTRVRPEACTQCHADLKTKTARATYAASVRSFAAHPEFAPLLHGDPGAIRMSHQVHLAENLRGPHGPVHLACSDCHTLEHGQMLRIDYAKHCASCHPLTFDPGIPQPAPHAKPQVVVDFVTQDRTRRAAGNAQFPWRKTCEQCHTLTFARGATIPEVAASQIPARWFRHARFDHDAHQMLQCTECHPRALTSTVSADVLIPGVETCRKCHRSGPEAADSTCSECHSYHDWTKQKPVDGKFTLRDFR